MSAEATLDLPGLILPSERSAVLSSCGQYRYELWRRWDDQRRYVCFVGLNPSTADAAVDDPTIIKCVKFARLWGFGALCMVNLFAFRATEPCDMMRAVDPVGPENDAHLLRCTAGAGMTVGAWGADGCHQNRAAAVRALLAGCQLYHLGFTKGGEPRHPLYRLDLTVPEPMEGGQEHDGFF